MGKASLLNWETIWSLVPMRYGKKPFSFWISAFGATVFSWTSRFLVVNALLLAFSPVTGKQLLAFGRQFILWIVMTVSPTPGGSGFSEYMFSQYYADFFPIAGTAGYRVYMANQSPITSI